MSPDEDADVMAGEDPEHEDPEGLDHPDPETPGALDPDQFDRPSE